MGNAHSKVQANFLENKVHLKSWLYKTRISKGMSQNELATAVGISCRISASSKLASVFPIREMP